MQSVGDFDVRQPTSVIHEPAIHEPYDNQHKYTIEFPKDGEYIVELTMEVEGQQEVIPFLIVSGEPKATMSIMSWRSSRWTTSLS